MAFTYYLADDEHFFNYEPDSETLRRALAEMIVDEYFGTFNDDVRPQLIKSVIRMIDGCDLEKRLIEDWKDDLRLRLEDKAYYDYRNRGDDYE